MLTTVAASALVTAIRDVTGQDVAGKVTDSQLIGWIDRENQELRRRIGDRCPIYDSIASFSLSGTWRYDVSAISDFGKPRVASYLSGDYYIPMRVAPVSEGEPSTTTMVDGSYRVRYISRAAAVTSGSSNLSLPAGAAEIIAQRVASRVRMRLEESGGDSHAAEAERATAELLSWLADFYRGTAHGGIVDAPPACSRAWRMSGTYIEVIPSRSPWA